MGERWKPEIGDAYYFFDSKGYTIDNKPCGVFEHFDHVREEWVK